MKNRGYFRLRYLSITLILSIPPTFTGDATTSIVKEVGKWALNTIGKAATTAVIAYGAKEYTSSNFDVDTGTFGIPSNITANPGVPVGAQNSTTYGTAAERQAQQEFDRLSREQQNEIYNRQLEAESKKYTQSEIDCRIKTHDSLIKSAQEEANYRKRKGQIDQATLHETRVKEYEAGKAILEKEKAERQPRNYKGMVKQLSDRSLKRLLRNTKEELAAEKKTLATENNKYWWSKDEGVINKTGSKITRLELTLKQIEDEQTNRTKSKVVTTTATAMVLTSKTAGTDKTTTTKMELAPEGGSGGSNQDPEKDPQKGPGLKDAAGVYGVKKAKEHLTEPHPESHSSTSTPHVDTHASSETSTKKYEKSREAHNKHEQKTFEQTQANVAQMRKDKPFKNEPKAPNPDLHQPPHITKKDLNYDMSPAKHAHIWNKKPAHVIEDTPEARRVFNECVHNPDNYIGQNLAGNFVYKGVNPKDGREIYVYVREGKVVDAGSSSKSWTNEMYLGLDKNVPKDRGDSVKYSFAAGAGAGLAGVATSETMASTLRPDIADQIKNNPNPFTMPDAPNNSISKVSQSPEMKAIVQRRIDHLKNMTPQERLQEISKPITKSPLPNGMRTPVFTSPNNNSSTEKTGQSISTSLPSSRPLPTVANSTPPTPKASTMVTAQNGTKAGLSITKSTSKSTMISVSKPSNSSSMPRSSTSIPRPSSTPSTTGTRIVTYTHTIGSGNGFKRN